MIEGKKKERRIEYKVLVSVLFFPPLHLTSLCESNNQSQSCWWWWGLLMNEWRRKEIERKKSSSSFPSIFPSQVLFIWKDLESSRIFDRGWVKWKREREKEGWEWKKKRERESTIGWITSTLQVHYSSPCCIVFPISTPFISSPNINTYFFIANKYISGEFSWLPVPLYSCSLFIIFSSLFYFSYFLIHPFLICSNWNLRECHKWREGQRKNTAMKRATPKRVFFSWKISMSINH